MGKYRLWRRAALALHPDWRSDRLFVAPEALSRYYLHPPRGGPDAPDSPIGATWMTSEDRHREIADSVGYPISR